VRSLAIERHIEGCESCSQAYQIQQDLKKALQAAPLRFTAPPVLRRRIRLSLGETREPALAGGALLWLSAWRWAGAVAALALVAVMSWNLGRVSRAPAGDELVAQEVIDSHVRSLMANHLEDVPSTDQHTVKPWFNGKLDVAPPVIDLTAQGFTLLGGRLDYIDGEPVASVVYQRRKHVINLFVAQRLGAKHAGEMTTTVQGYNVRHWTEEGLDFWAVSDLAPDELDEFIQKISASLHPSAAPGAS
jgi:anti-sigma factor RsiW